MVASTLQLARRITSDLSERDLNKMHRELWLPAEELAEFNQHIVGPIEVIEESG